jgi:hypothetical protein
MHLSRAENGVQMGQPVAESCAFEALAVAGEKTLRMTATLSLPGLGRRAVAP